MLLGARFPYINLPRIANSPWPADKELNKAIRVARVTPLNCHLRSFDPAYTALLELLL